MEWVYFSKLERCGTRPGAVRAEVVADCRLRAVTARKARREQLCRADEHRLLNYSRFRQLTPAEDRNWMTLARSLCPLSSIPSLLRFFGTAS